MTEQRVEPGARTPHPGHSKHDDWWCECGSRVEDCDYLQENLMRGSVPPGSEERAGLDGAVFETCPVCGASAQVTLRPDWQRGVNLGQSIPIIGCGNPWHYNALTPTQTERTNPEGFAAQVEPEGSPRPSGEGLLRFLRAAPTRRMFARALGGGEHPSDEYLSMATQVLGKVATEVESKPWLAATPSPERQEQEALTRAPNDKELEQFAGEIKGSCEIAGSHYVYPRHAAGVLKAAEKHGLIIRAALSQPEQPKGVGE